MIVPFWTSASFWPFLVYPNLSFREFIVDCKKFENAQGIYQVGSVPSVFNSEFQGTVLALKFDARSSPTASISCSEHE